jgi:hypothetical protein
MSTLDQIRQSIEARIDELTDEMSALHAARAALHGPSAITATPAAATNNAAKPRRRRTAKAVKTTNTEHAANGATPASDGAVANAPAVAAAKVPATRVAASRKPRTRAQTKPTKSDQPVEVLLSGKLEAMLSVAGDGLSAVTISKRANAGYDQVRDLLRDLESTGQVRRTGSRRTSLWRLITDEDRIAERAAQLESLSTAKPLKPA